MVMDKAIRQPQINWKLLGLTAFLAVQLALLPVRQAQAAIPALLAGLGLFIKTPLGKSVIASLAIHAAVLAVEFHNTASAAAPSSDAEKKLEVKLNPKDPMSTPAGWTAGTPANPDPSPPGTGTVVPTVKWNLSGSGVVGSPSIASPTAEGATLQYCQSVGSSNVQVAYSNANAGQFICLSPNGAAWADFVKVNVNGCSAGYTYNGTTCVLSNAAIVQKPSDGKAEIKRVGNVFYVDARDTADGLPPGVTVATDKVTAVSNDGLKTVTATIAADGTTKIVSTAARSDGSGKTDQETVNTSAPNSTTGAVEVLGVSAKVLSGTGTEIAAVADSGGTSDAKDSTLQAIKTSIDAAKTADAADRTAAETAASGQGAALTALKAPGQDTVGGLGLPTQGQFGVSDVGGIANALPSSGTGGCVALDITLPYLGLLHIAPCAVVTAVAPLVNFLVVALGVAGGIFQILGRREET